MCYSYEVSVITFLIGAGLSAINFFMFKNKPVYVCITLIWFFAVSIQFWEALLWKGVNCNFISKMLMINNLIQPLIWLSFLFIPGYIKNNNINLYLVALVAGIYGIYVLQYFNKDYGCIKTNNGINFKWWDNIGGWLYIIACPILTKLLIKGEMGNYQTALVIGSLLIGHLLSKKFKTGKDHLASVWCWVAAFVPLINNVLFSHNI